jgi:hypothetical protein
MRVLPLLAPLALLIGAVATRYPSGEAIHVRVEPRGCKPAPPLDLEVAAVPAGRRTARITVTATPRFDAETIAISIAPVPGVSIASADPAASGPLGAGKAFRWEATAVLDAASPGARLLVDARMRFTAPGHEGSLENAGALRGVDLGDPPPEIPGRVVRTGDEFTVEIPAVVVR